MKKEEFRINIAGVLTSFKRVNKTSFVNWFNKEENNHKQFFVCGSQTKPYTSFGTKNIVEKVKSHFDFETIERFIFYFEYYNCNLFETGYYAKYYIEI